MQNSPLTINNSRDTVVVAKRKGITPDTWCDAMRKADDSSEYLPYVALLGAVIQLAVEDESSPDPTLSGSASLFIKERVWDLGLPNRLIASIIWCARHNGNYRAVASRVNRAG